MNPRPGIEGHPAPDFNLAQTLAADGTPAAEQGIAEEEALKKGMEEKSKEFLEHGAALYHNA